jgi:hypothetical protein
MAWKNHQNHVVVVLLTVFVFLSVELLAFYTGFLFPHLLCGEQQHGHAAVLQGQQEGSRLRLVKNAVKPEATTTTSKIGSIINSASPNQRTIKNQYGAGSRRSGNNCQSLDNAARQMNASENSRLGCLLRRHAEKWMNKHIILGTVSVTSVEYVEMTKAWLHSIKDAGDDANVLLVGMTPGTCELLLRHNVPYCVPVEWIGLSEQQVVTTPLVIERGYTTSGKWIIILAILEAGYDVVFLDMDIHVRNSLFNSSVFDWDQDSYDLRTQTDLIPSNRESFFESTYIFEGKYKCGMGFKDPDWQKSLWLDKRKYWPHVLESHAKLKAHVELLCYQAAWICQRCSERAPQGWNMGTVKLQFGSTGICNSIWIFPVLFPVSMAFLAYTQIYKSFWPSRVPAEQQHSACWAVWQQV